MEDKEGAGGIFPPAKEMVRKGLETWVGLKQRQEDPRSDLYLLASDRDPGPPLGVLGHSCEKRAVE